MIRLAEPEDLAALPAIEVAAGELFRAVGMDEIADDPPPSPAALAGYQAEGRAWVATDELDHPVAYVLVELIGLDAHIEQDVPWNAPYYARIGFRIVPPENWSPDIRGIVAAEAGHGLRQWPRVVMKRELPGR